MKIAITQLNYHIGNFEVNFSKIKKAIKDAESEGADIVLFGELAVCGYPPRDFLEFNDFITKCNEVIENIKPLTHKVAVVIGAPSVNPLPEGKDLFNSAFFIANEKILSVSHKALLPTYDVFDEYRYFEPSKTFETIQYKGKKIALTICEDIWNIGNENPLYKVCPMDILINQKPDFILNLSASPFSYNQAETRKKIVSANAKRYGIPLFYANHVGAQTELIFDGGSLAANSKGEIVAELPYFKECIQIINTNEIENVVPNLQEVSDIEKIHQALITGIKQYFEKLGFKKAVLGLSGGIDSALVLALAVEALGRENVMSVLMPSQYSSDHSVDDSIKMVNNLKSPYKTIPIKDMYYSVEKSLNPHFEEKEPDVTEENIQARLRGVTLMAISNKLGYILLNTSNKSEAAVGYGTLYGDMCGGLAVIGDLYKNQVYALCNHINRNEEIIPENILTKAPSAELRPDQKDSDSLPDYEILDAILFHYIEERLDPKEIIALGYKKSLVNRILKLVNQSEWKRHQMPPVLRISPKAFGMGRRLPIAAKYLS
ncbi:NAD+ synthase [uncultured Formosa sp.]|uniref:NAD+ synthase n=1 Tax=uncultured Formosa sp. TaxID=255435 RepID=UPI00262F836E|nr:NAD+ synthase [uncultured Formosa sp.]